MSNRRAAGLLATTMLVVAACNGSGATPAPASHAATTGPAASTTASQVANASGGACSVGVSWNNFQQPRWAAHDKPAIQQTVTAGGGTYTDADANLSSEQQATDISTMVNKGVKVLIVLAQDTTAALPAIKAAEQAGVHVIAYDRLIEDPSVLYITFDNVGVGQAEAAAVLAKVPPGTTAAPKNYVLIKGDPGDPNAATFLPSGWDAAGLKAAVDAGTIKILNGTTDAWPKNAGTYTTAWKTETAQTNMEAIIDKANSDGTKIDAILAENDSTALGVVGALTSKSYGSWPPLSGQDGDTANLNNVALGKQYVDVWKSADQLGKAAGAAALALCQGGQMASLTLQNGLVDPSVAPKAGLTAQPFMTPGGNTVSSFILQPTPITADNLNLVIDSHWVTKDQVCAGVDTTAATAPAACK
jgi:D-xylose transport system substrate-binding protein